MVNGSDWLDKSESRKYLAGGAGALMTGNVLLSGRDGPTLTASPTRNTGPDRTLGKDRWKKVEVGGRHWGTQVEEISWESRKSPVTEMFQKMK